MKKPKRILKRKCSLSIPPHENAEVHKRVMRRLKSMSNQEIFQIAVDAGIYTKDGKLTENYS